MNEVESDQRVKDIFSSIAPRYDFLNSFLSFGLHKIWKAKSINQLGISEGDMLLDVCAGTGDLSREMSKRTGARGKVVAVDFCEDMLVIGREKAKKLGQSNVEFIKGSALELPAADNEFDGVIIGFGIRNISDRLKAFTEFYRVLKPSKRLVCLEFSQPDSQRFSKIYFFYLDKFAVKLGNMITGTSAHSYLSQSIRDFLSKEELKEVMEKAGFKKVTYDNLTGGVATIHIGIKS